MDFLQSLLENNNLPLLSAFILGLMTAISPCPLTTNITATAFISKNVTSKRKVFLSGVIYSLGRAFSYTTIGLILFFVLACSCIGSERDSGHDVNGRWQHVLASSKNLGFAYPIQFDEPALTDPPTINTNYIHPHIRLFGDGYAAPSGQGLCLEWAESKVGNVDAPFVQVQRPTH